MRFTQKIKYNLKHAIPMVAIAGAGMMSSCEKEVVEAMHDVKCNFFQAYYEEVTTEKLQEYARDKSVRYIYLNVANGGDYTNFWSHNISNMRNFLSERIQIAPNKIRCTGNFRFEPGVTSKQDSLWFTQQGWTVNQHLQNQK